MYQKILVAVENSEIGQYIFEQGVNLAKASNAEIMLLHVISPVEDPYITPIFLQPDTTYPGWQTESMDNYIQHWEKLKQEKLEWLRSLTDAAINIGVKAGFTQKMGDPGRTICEIARSWSADLIMVGRRGRAGLSEFLLGSVSNYVLHHAHCSVLVIQGQTLSSTV
ncbi:universal stress protein [Nostoc parmelioides]|uniref:Universal stress protein n=1 Tax=Nostoc parmelioides FACHB-3921 TaxID=2692909 RepID=A0ABR8BCM2_9NOSO|nr:universal stress protein [Nostoc parmelioides]MBD2250630.1 universal stress protein [Nostoc parmelioides FACHB-3921]